MHTLVTDDPAFHKALHSCGVDRQLCVVHMRCTVLREIVQLVRHLPLWGGPRLLVCYEWAHQGVIWLSPPVLSLVEPVMDRWNDLVRCTHNPAIPPARTGRGLV